MTPPAPRRPLDLRARLAAALAPLPPRAEPELGPESEPEPAPAFAPAPLDEAGPRPPSRPPAPDPAPDPAPVSRAAPAATAALPPAATPAPAAAAPPTPAPATAPTAADRQEPSWERRSIEEIYHLIQDPLHSRLNLTGLLAVGREQVQSVVSQQVAAICSQDRLPVSQRDQARLVAMALDDLFGVGPLEPLLADPGVSDILVNGPDQVYVERRGRLERTDTRFRDPQHVLNIAQRIATTVGRRVDEASPMVDARMPDGSRVNVVLPPLALDGPCISIRKFNPRRVGFDEMIVSGSVSPNSARILEIAGTCRLNILISGGTGSGKTTMMNAISRKISPQERIITIEDAAELQLEQPHVVRLEARPANAEGAGQIAISELLRNALRMRPDRIIIGECRGIEAFDLLQAMNTGHDGSMSTLHANSPRDALVRLENMVLMGNGRLPVLAIRQQIASAINLLVHVERMRDGVRRLVAITEVVGIESEVILTQDLVTFEFDYSDDSGMVVGRFKSSGIRPHFMQQASLFGLADRLLEAMRA